MSDPDGCERLLGADEALVFELGQPWRDGVEAGFRPTVVRAWCRGGALVVEAEMVDEEVFNDATAHNQRTWELGDVFEIFVRREDEERYAEVHVTPDNLRLHLRFEDFGHLQRIADPAEVAADPDAVASSAERTPDGWRARATIPLDLRAGERIRVSFCRYDAGRGREPVLSTSSPHPVVAFHRPWEWLPCRIGNG
jgi:hypothetical protein